MTFVSDTTIMDATCWDCTDDSVPSGLLLFRNGIRYRIDYGKVSWIQDRNGNRITFRYDEYSYLIEIVDSVDRTITIQQMQGYDQIQFPGAGGASRTIEVDFGNTSTVLDLGYTTHSYYDLFGTYGGSSTPADLQVVTAVKLPDSVPDSRLSYRFRYNDYSEVTSVVLPTGGAIKYTHGAGDTSQGMVIYNGGNPYVYRRVLTRDVYPDGSTLEQHAVYSPGGGRRGLVQLREQLEAIGARVVGEVAVPKALNADFKAVARNVAEQPAKAEAA